VTNERREVLESLAQRRDADPQDVEAVAQIVPESSGAHFSTQCAIRRGHDSRVDLACAGFSEPANLALLQRAQQLGLHTRAQFGDLIEKHVPPCDSSNNPARSATAPVKAPRV
jgi:hypothetical protein